MTLHRSDNTKPNRPAKSKAIQPAKPGSDGRLREFIVHRHE